MELIGNEEGVEYVYFVNYLSRTICSCRIVVKSDENVEDGMIDIEPNETPSPTGTPDGTNATPSPTKTPDELNVTPSPTGTPEGTNATPSPTKTPDEPNETPSPTKTPEGTNETPSPTKTPDEPNETPSPTGTPDEPNETPSPTKTPDEPSVTPSPTKIPDENSVTPSSTGTSDGRSSFVSVKKLGKVKNIRVKNKKKQKVIVLWDWKVDMSGFEIQYAENQKFTKKKKSKMVGKRASQETITKLKKGKTYYVRVRAYKELSGKKIYGNWSKIKKIKIRK